MRRIPNVMKSHAEKENCKYKKMLRNVRQDTELIATV